MTKRIGSLLVALWMISVGTAADFLTLRSSYLGNGLFEYRLELPDDNFFTNASIGTFSVSFTNRQAFVITPTDWMPLTSELNQAIWNFDTNALQSRPYTATFQVQSTSTTFRTLDAAAFVSYQATPAGALLTTNFPALAGFGVVKALVPCDPAQADGSASTLEDCFAVRDDLRITGLTTISGEATALSFWWDSDSTVQVQSSPDLSIWTVQTNLLGNAGTNRWTLPSPLSATSRYFRLRLLATEKRPELIETTP